MRDANSSLAGSYALSSGNFNSLLKVSIEGLYPVVSLTAVRNANAAADKNSSYLLCFWLTYADKIALIFLLMRSVILLCGWLG